jgi:hypothetical protein
VVLCGAYLVTSGWRFWLSDSFSGGTTAFVVPVLFALMALGPLLVVLSWRGSRATSYALALTLVLSTIALVVVPVHVERAWRQCVALAVKSPEDPSRASWLMGQAFTRAETTQFIACVTLSLVLPGLLVIWRRRWTRHEHLRVHGIAVPFVATSLGAMIWCAGSVGAACLVWEPMHLHSHASLEEVRAVFSDPLAWLSLGRLGVGVFAAAATAVLLYFIWLDHRRNAPIPRWVFPAGLSCFLLGALAWSLTRPLAHDAAYPPPAWVTWQHSAHIRVELPPRGASCAAARGTALLEWMGDRVMIDGLSHADSAGVRATLQAKASLGKIVFPDQFVPALSVAAPGRAPMSDLLPLMEAARVAGYDEVDALVGHPPRTFATRTRGTLFEVHHFCRVTWRLDAPLPAADDWGRLLDQMGRGAASSPN